MRLITSSTSPDVIGQTETVIDTRSNERVATIPLGGEVGGSQFSRIENLVYVNVKTKAELIAIDPVLDAVVARYRCWMRGQRRPAHR